MELSATRLYASSIALVSGAYSLLTAGGSLAALGIGGVVMLIVGVAVLVHGVVLLTPAVELIRRASGPLMILWAFSMLGNQALLAVMPGWGMGGSMAMASPVGWDPGMVAIAAIMLSSGLIMSVPRSDAGGM